MTQDKFLIIGATGKTGRRVTRLLAAGGHHVRETSRSTAIPFDWNDPSTWRTALQDMTVAYVVLPSLGSPEALTTVGDFAAVAAETGLRRAVLVSFPSGGNIDFDVVKQTEAQLATAGIGLTVLRLRWVSQNFSEDFLAEPVLAGELRLPAGDGREAFVDADDIAEVAVAALTDDRHAGREYELTGSEVLSFHDVAAELSRSIGRRISYVPVTLEEFVAEQTSYGVPADWAQMLGSLYEHIGTDQLATTTTDVADILDRDPRTFAQFATSAVSAGAWV